MTPRRYQFIRWQLLVMWAAAIALVALGSFGWELFFLLSLVGLLVATEGSAPYEVTPEWRTRVHRVVYLGLAGFCLVVVLRALPIIRSLA